MAYSLIDTHLVVCINGELQVCNILQQRPPGGVDLHCSFRDGHSLTGLQVLHLPQQRHQLRKRTTEVMRNIPRYPQLDGQIRF